MPYVAVLSCICSSIVSKAFRGRNKWVVWWHALIGKQTWLYENFLEDTPANVRMSRFVLKILHYFSL
jgi:hypothetical protein